MKQKYERQFSDMPDGTLIKQKKALRQPLYRLTENLIF